MSEAIRTKLLIVGSGGNGMSAAVMFKRAGIDDFRIITRHGDFGGCWWSNRYPGCSSDTQIMPYQFSYAVKVDWPSTHASAAQITDYIKDIAQAEGIYPHTDFNVEMTGAEWDEQEGRWLVETTAGLYSAEFLLPAAGYLDDPIIPEIPGMENFKGRIFHSSAWPHGYSGAGENVAVVGTGSSSLQIVPDTQKVAKNLVVFQRTPNHIIPRNFRYFTDEELNTWRSNPEEYHKARQEFDEFSDGRWQNAFLGGDKEIIKEAEELARRHLEDQVKDPVLRAKLTPSHTFACKRPGSSDDFYLALQGPNVTFVNEAAAGFGENSIISASGEAFEVDAVCLATGFLFGGHILEMIKRRDGVTVADYQKGHHRAYKSTTVAGCPNMFLIGGSGPNGQIYNGMQPGETVSGYIIEAIKHMEVNNIRALEVKEESELSWKAKADEILAKSGAIAGGCVNYSQDESGHNKAAWPGGMQNFKSSFSEFDAEHYVAI